MSFCFSAWHTARRMLGIWRSRRSSRDPAVLYSCGSSSVHWTHSTDSLSPTGKIDSAPKNVSVWVGVFCNYKQHVFCFAINLVKFYWCSWTRVDTFMPIRTYVKMSVGPFRSAWISLYCLICYAIIRYFILFVFVSFFFLFIHSAFWQFVCYECLKKTIKFDLILDNL